MDGLFPNMKPVVLAAVVLLALLASSAITTVLKHSVYFTATWSKEFRKFCLLLCMYF